MTHHATRTAWHMQTHTATSPIIDDGSDINLPVSIHPPYPGPWARCNLFHSLNKKCVSVGWLVGWLEKERKGGREINRSEMRYAPPIGLLWFACCWPMGFSCEYFVRYRGAVNSGKV